MCVFKDLFGLLAVLKQVQSTHFEPMWSNFGPSQGRKAFTTGQYGTTNGLKAGQSHGFTKKMLVQMWSPNGWVVLIFSHF